MVDRQDHPPGIALYLIAALLAAVGLGVLATLERSPYDLVLAGLLGVVALSAYYGSVRAAFAVTLLGALAVGTFVVIRAPQSLDERGLGRFVLFLSSAVLVVVAARVRVRANESISALRRSEARSRAIGESLPFGVWFAGGDGRIEYVSDSFLQLTGLTLEDCRRRGLAACLDPDDVEHARREWARCLSTGEPWDQELRVVAADGQPASILSRGVPIRDALGHITGWSGINLDMTHRLRVEEERELLFRQVHLQAEQLEALLKAAPVGIALFDSELRYTRINQALASIHGVPIDRHLGRTVTEAVPRLAPAIEPILRQVLDTGRPVLQRESSGQVVEKGEAERHWLASYYPVKPWAGEALGVGCVVVETTERKRLEAERTALLAREDSLARQGDARAGGAGDGTVRSP